MEINALTSREYRKFGLTFAIVICLLFGLFLPWLFGLQRPWWPWLVAIVLITWSIISPVTLWIIYKPWMRFAAILGFVNTRILLGLVFFLLFVPIAIILRLFRIDPLDRAVFGTQCTSYWKESNQADSQSMENMY